MSEPKRYYAVIPGAGEKEQQDIFYPYGVPFSIHPKGEWVRYEDYARLKAEVERLTAKQTDIDRVQAQSDFYRSKLMNETAYSANVQLLDQVKHLEAQVKRLTKAGDAMMDWIDYQPDGRGYIHSEAWEAAKKGGQP